MAVSSWLKFFRVVNLPTVPGDVLVGAAAAICRGGFAGASSEKGVYIALAAVSSCFLYLFGLADNDIAGATTDRGRPIPNGEISMPAARLARGICLAFGFLALLLGGTPLLPSMAVAVAIVAAVVAYNRTKNPLLMGLCRGLNVLLGAGGVFVCVCGHASASPRDMAIVAAVALVWTVYVAAVTKYSEGEELDSARRRRVGMLVGGIVYLQLVALIVFTLVDPALKPLLVAGAVLLILLRVMRRALPKVSAS